jgi:hypothetical protein
MRRVLTLLLSFVFVLAFISCGGKEADISKELKSKGTLELMQEAADDQYESPADQRLTDKQLQMYLKVREHEKKILEVAKKEAEAHAQKAEKAGDKSLAGMMAGLKTLGSVADMVTADIRAAKELGFNTAEYSWVKEKVLEASGAEFGQKLSDSMSTMFDSQIVELKKQLETATDDSTKQYLQEALAGAEKAKQEMAAQQDQQDPHIAANRELLAKYDSALTSFAHEIMKYGSEEDQAKAQKDIQDWEKKLDQAAASAQKP